MLGTKLVSGMGFWYYRIGFGVSAKTTATAVNYSFTFINFLVMKLLRSGMNTIEEMPVLHPFLLSCLQFVEKICTHPIANTRAYLPVYVKLCPCR